MTINVVVDNGKEGCVQEIYRDIKSWMITNDNGRDLVIICENDAKVVINRTRWIKVIEQSTTGPKEV